MRSLFLKIFLWFWVANMVVAAMALIATFLFHRADDPDALRWRLVVSHTLRPQGREALDELKRGGEAALAAHLDRVDRATGARSFLLDESGRELRSYEFPSGLPELAMRARHTGKLEVASSEGMTLVAVSVPGDDERTYVFARLINVEPDRRAGRPPHEHGPRDALDWHEHRGRRPPHDHSHEHDRDHDDDARSADDGDDSATAGARPAEWRGPPPGGGPGPDTPRRPPTRGEAAALQQIVREPGVFVAILAAVVASGGLVCYALARYLTRPVRLVRVAARKLADGDLTARVGLRAGRRRDEIGELGRDFDFMAEKLESLVSAQRRLLRDISHELRSPLSRLNVALELARRDADASLDPALDRISHESDRVNELIGSVLTLARLESGAPRGERVEIDLAELISAIVADADYEATPRGVRVRIGQAHACRVLGSPVFLRSAIENVVRNAVRFTREGTTVDVQLTCVARDGRQLAAIAVRDHGPGVAENELQAIFRPFYRVSDARERETGGTGLGLAITQRVVASHEGVVTAENAPGGGLVVRIELPAHCG